MQATGFITHRPGLAAISVGGLVVSIWALRRFAQRRALEQLGKSQLGESEEVPTKKKHATCEDEATQATENRLQKQEGGFQQTIPGHIWDAARQTLSRQVCLRAQLADVLSAYPRTFLYEDEQDSVDEATQIRGFSAFLRYLRDSLQDSPRNLLLRDLTRRLQATAFSASRRAEALVKLQELLGFETVGVSLLQLVERYEALSPGRVYTKWRAAVAAAEKVDALQALDVVNKVREGFRLKAVAKGLEPSEEELGAAVERARAVARQRREENRRRAAELRVELDHDTEYLQYLRCSELWETSGVGQLWNEYVGLDRDEGEERRARGASFEDTWAPSLFALVVEALLARSTGSMNREDFKYVKGALWRNDQNRGVGEVDLVVLHQGKDGTREEAVALVEMKSGCFEVAAASYLHTRKLEEAQQAHGGPSLYDGDTKKKIVISPAAQVFIGTRVPFWRPGIGADPKIIRIAGEALFDMTRYYTSAGMVCAPSVQNNATFDLEDEVLVKILMTTIHEEPTLKGRLQQSPLYFIETAPNVLILESNDLEVPLVNSPSVKFTEPSARKVSPALGPVKAPDHLPFGAVLPAACSQALLDMDLGNKSYSKKHSSSIPQRPRSVPGRPRHYNQQQRKTSEAAVPLPRRSSSAPKKLAARKS